MGLMNTRQEMIESCTNEFYEILIWSEKEVRILGDS